MIKNWEILRRLEDDYRAQENLSYQQKLDLFEGMWKEAVELGVLPSKNPLEGIEVTIQIAKIMNSCLTKP